MAPNALLERISSVLGEVMTVTEEDDGLTVIRDGLVASVRVVTIAEGLELVSLTQPIAWDLPLNAKLREGVADHARRTMLGTIVLVEKLSKGPEAPVNGSSSKSATRKVAAKKTADVLLRYNFPAAGLSDDALRTLILLVLAAGEDVRKALAP
jgi:hypothetical protein